MTGIQILFCGHGNISEPSGFYTRKHMSPITLPKQIRTPLEQEFDRLFREHYQLVYRTAYGVTGSPEDAEDVLQTIFLRLIGRDVPPDLQRNPRAYLYRSAVNLSLNTVR